MEKAAKGEYVQYEWEELTRLVCYWPKEVYQPYETDKLFTLAIHIMVTRFRGRQGEGG